MRNPIYTIADNQVDLALPFRNPLCPEYDECLTQAALANLLLDCSGCEFKGCRTDVSLCPWELSSCNRLLQAVFRP